MPKLNFGQPVGTVCQTAYIVEDIHRAMERFTRTLRIGPWFYMPTVQLKNATYRGRPMNFRGSLAAANTGAMMIELIHQDDDAPTMFTEMIKTRGYGLHHHGIAVKDFDAEVKAYTDMGYELAFYGETDLPNRNAYIDMKGDLPCFLELIEATEPLEALFGAVYQASIEWNGLNPVRDFASLLR
jgi:Glyoxalase/Bleomycin resistance protein/Dioxygenase superfamily